MKKFTFSFFALLGFAITFTACNQEKPPTTPVDEEFPTITLTSPIEVPLGQYVTFESDDSIIIDIRFDDDVDLDRYEVTLTYAFDNYYLKTDNFPWSLTYYGDLDGQSGAFNHVEYVVFDPSAGPYRFHIKVWDAEGNLTEKTTWLFLINLNDVTVPNVIINTPDPVDTFSIGNVMTINANISDPVVVSNAYARVRNLVTKDVVPNSEIWIDSIWQGAYLLDTFFTIPAGVTPGDYWVEVYARDDVYNMGYDSVRVFIRP